jgi:TonB-dependent SusC/RagA subfamily outer membrane receptor
VEAVPTTSGSTAGIKVFYLDSTSVVFKGTSGGKPIEFRAEKVSYNDLGSEKKSNIVLKQASSPKEKPLIVIDGLIMTDMDMNKISPNNIQSINVLKGESAKAKYAEKGANGVVEITTKKP